MKELTKYSMGIGDRFSKQGQYQLKAFAKALENGIEITPVWNKSNREHVLVNSSPIDTRIEADTAAKSLNWEKPYFVDADHINLKNVNWFLNASDFFTLDVADAIGGSTDNDLVKQFVKTNYNYIGLLKIDNIKDPFVITLDDLTAIAVKFAGAIQEIASIYKYIKASVNDFITEVSMDETSVSQTPVELFFILKSLAELGIPVQTIAPKFSGKFLKGIDYIGDIEKFRIEFEQDILVIQHVIKHFGLPKTLKLSVHSGSDKFKIYPIINELIKKHDIGVHVKTAGTTWLEEVIGLAISGDKGLNLVKKIYSQAFARIDELSAPYHGVIEIETSNLPSIATVNSWNGTQFADTLRHVQSNILYNTDFRQLMHLAYKIAAELNKEYYVLLEENKEIVGQCVYENIYDRHILCIFA